jgi:pSer/pThr/pTyr-binding forkhead associated (FHA) protein
LLSQYETISRKHAEIIFESENGDDSYSLTDTDSRNGTTLNGTKLGPAEKRILKNSDEIRLGKTLVASLIFRSETR